MAVRPEQTSLKKSEANMLGSTQVKSVPYHHEDRQWDARFNVQSGGALEDLLQGIRSDEAGGRFKYILVGGKEIGTRSYQNDYGIEHVHVAAIFNNRTSKRAILKNWNVKEGNGYYLVPRYVSYALCARTALTIAMLTGTEISLTAGGRSTTRKSSAKWTPKNSFYLSLDNCPMTSSDSESKQVKKKRKRTSTKS